VAGPLVATGHPHERLDDELGAAAVHRQFHHPADRLERALAQAGLKLRARLGQLPGAVLDEGFSELDHAKSLYVSTHARGGAS